MIKVNRMSLDNITDEIQIQEMIDVDGTGDFFLETLAETLKQLDDGIPIFQSTVEKYDINAFREHAHYLKGSTKTLGLALVADWCVQMQILEEEDTIENTISKMKSMIDELIKRIETTRVYLTNVRGYLT